MNNDSGKIVIISLPFSEASLQLNLGRPPLVVAVLSGVLKRPRVDQTDGERQDQRERSQDAFHLELLMWSTFGQLKVLWGCVGRERLGINLG